MNFFCDSDDINCNIVDIWLSKPFNVLENGGTFHCSFKDTPACKTNLHIIKIQWLYISNTQVSRYLFWIKLITITIIGMIRLALP